MKTSYSGRILVADLSAGTTRFDRIPEDITQPFLGGRGVAAHVLWDKVTEETGSLDPENFLLFAPGVLTGTSAPCSGRTTVTTKGPATESYLKTNVGGHLGVALKMAGLDLLAVTGASDCPLVLVLSPEGARLVPGEHVWGLSVRETTRTLRSEYGNDAEVVCIGPAGEKLVRFAAIMTSVYNAAARGGIGAVMGSKRLKAIVITSNGGRVDVADPEAYARVAQQMRSVLYGDSVAPDLHKFGTARDIDLLNELHLLPTHNFQRSTIPGDAYALSGRSWPERGYLKRIVGCGACIYGCHRFTGVDEGPYAGVQSGGPEYETVAAFGSGCGILDIEPVFAANELCNDLGLDTISTGNVIQWAMETAERGVLKPDARDGLDLSFGNAETMLELIRRIAKREGIGDLLAEGVTRASQHVGGGSEAWAVAARGLEQSNVEVRGAFSYALAFAVNPRGPDHLHSECLAEFGGTREGIKLVERITGDERLAVPNTEEGRETIVRWHEDMYAVSDALGLCAFATTAAYSLDENLIAELLAAATGQRMSGPELMNVGRRIETLERCYCLREGLVPRTDDRLPARMMQEAPADLAGGEPMSEERLKRMLQQYYTRHGWDPMTGYPTEATLKELGLGFVASTIRDAQQAHAMEEGRT